MEFGTPAIIIAVECGHHALKIERLCKQTVVSLLWPIHDIQGYFGLTSESDEAATEIDDFLVEK